MRGPDLQALVLNPGEAAGLALVLSDPLSFWGGYDPETGTIIDQSHPQVGMRLAERILLLPGSRGSAGTPAGLAESFRLGSGPAAIVLKQRDTNIAVGALVADRLYGLSTPVVVLPGDLFGQVRDGDRLCISRAGRISWDGTD